MPSAYEHHCLRINLTGINSITDHFSQSIANYNNVPHIQLLYKKLLRELNGINLRQGNRQKRGLFNKIGSAYKYLFGTLDDNDRVEIQKHLEALGTNSVKLHELNDVMQLINKEMQKIVEFEIHRISIDTLVHELLQFTEYIEDIEMGMQLSRLGLFNPKLLNYDKLENVNAKNILSIKTSTWINYKDNLLLITSHIPTNQEVINTVKIIPYPDHNGYQLNHTNTLSYFEKDGKVFTSENIKIDDECICSMRLCNIKNI